MIMISNLHMHIFRSNASIFLDFGYLYFMLTLFQFLHKYKYYLKCENDRFGLSNYFIRTRILNKVSIKYQSLPKSRKK